VLLGITKADRNFKEQNDALREELANLQATISTLRERNKALVEQLEKKKKELAMAKKDKSSATSTFRRPLSASGTAKPDIEIVAGPNPRHSALPHPPAEPADNNWFSIAQQLKAR
jgi:DNA repair exonuclease SbcCD ATPase subunit